ncbi:hypothetical protein BVG16_24715 [Paenibacillus selenitireducens]|uniref:Uncharacterized protein n=1 Tax=Paenibacillus selenitireducens TaxID=1324314 RepID=A0A1T2X365_9BACL|nr:hypothetical protein [Paenibacillus selenitireducens]OPA74328.1 hypothetical protein BVG16_24715 [Paenibacillus selenitireducens]
MRMKMSSHLDSGLHKRTMSPQVSEAARNKHIQDAWRSVRKQGGSIQQPWFERLTKHREGGHLD